MSQESQLSEVFIKQRRNLLLISCILIFITYTNIDIQDISLLGIKLKNSSNPDAIIWAAWSIFLYFTIRYYQYFVQEAYPVLIKTFTTHIDNRIANFSRKQMLIVSDNQSTYEPNPYNGLMNTNWSFQINVPKKRILGKTREAETIDCQFTKREILSLYVKSLVYITFHHHNVSDYLFPFLLALSCVIYKAFSIFTFVT